MSFVTIKSNREKIILVCRKERKFTIERLVCVAYNQKWYEKLDDRVGKMLFSHIATQK